MIIVTETVRLAPKYDYLSVPSWLRLPFEGHPYVDSRWHWHDKPKTIIYVMSGGNDHKVHLPRNPWRHDNLRIMRDSILRADR